MSNATAPPKHTNRLAKENSPYLLQHAHNPVDWYAWGPEAFEAARAQDKPIFLSVGYSTCYWCHVMERQSFENEEIAAEMNKRFINIKVDREERPDVDQLFMIVPQVITRHGGWPMSVFLTPDLKPFYGGTYYPPADSYGRPGFLSVLTAIEEAYRNRREQVEQSYGQILNIMQQVSEPPAPATPLLVNDALVDRILDRSTSDYDRANGGFGGAPKFPRQTLIELLLVHNRYFPNEARSRMVLHTLDALASGGIRDHLGGGFHRYSTDAKWLVPHFEIMLYDNAMLAWCYVEAYRQTEEMRYAHVARGILDFVLREMTSPDGAFYTAMDAEVDAQEGLSYLWTPDEIAELLGDEDASFFNHVYGVDRGPNFADPHHGSGEPEKNILYLPESLDVFAARAGIDIDALDARLQGLRQKLYAARARRKQPLLDTKVLTSWNALMIRALAHAGGVLQESRYVAAGERCATYLLAKHRTREGKLFRTSRDGTVKYNGFLDDYACLAQALIALHDSGADEKWKDEGRLVFGTMRDLFGGEQGGGFYFTDTSATDLIVRQKTATDSPLPSGNAIAALAAVSLGQLDIAQQVLTAFAEQMQATGEGMSSMVEAMVTYLLAAPDFTVAPGAAVSDIELPLTPQQVAAGVVTVKAAWSSPAELHLHLNILGGFHINANNAAEQLIPTQIAGLDDRDEIASIDYPPGEETRFTFATDPIRVYQGEIEILINLKRAVAAGPLRLALSYQACDENACLPPVTKSVEIPTP